MRREWFRGLKEKLLLGALTFVLVSVFGLWGGLVCRADSQAKVTARSANIRKEASTSSAVVGSTKKDSVLTVISQVQGSDGHTWYEVYVDANTKGYIRSDLVTITEGGTPPDGGADNETPVDVTPVNPVGAAVSNESGRGRIRSNASTTSQILAEVPNGAEVTVTGQAQDAEGRVWYQVSYASEGSQVNGFIRSDYLELSGDVTPDNPPDEGGDNPPAPSAPDKAYDTILQDGVWFLYDTATNEGYSVQDLFSSVNNANKNAQLYEELNQSATNQKIIIIVLIFLVVAAVAVIAFLVFKIRDMMDAAYFSEVENDTLRKKKAAGNQGGGQRVMHTVGTDKQPSRPAGTQGQKPQGRSAGAPQGGGQGGPQGQRPQGSGQGGPQRSMGAQRPQGSGQVGSQGQRPQGGTQAGGPQGQRPQGSGQGGPQGQRPQGSPQAGGQRPQGGAPAGSPQGSGQGGSQGQRPQGSGQAGGPQGSGQGDLQGQRPAGAQGQRPQGARPGAAPQEDQQKTQRQAKNFMADEEDEFDFDFLNYDEDGEQQ